MKKLYVGMASRCLSLAVLLIVAAALSACATKPPADDPFAVAAYEEANDPLEPLNRTLFEVDQGLDTVLVRPIVEGYRFVIPPRGRKSVTNFVNHIRSPITFVHDVLQVKPNRAGVTLGRFVVNTTMGFFGFFDVGAQIGLPYHIEDLGQTMAEWGVEEGPYVYVPLLGPSNFRDGFGFLVDAFLVDPLGWYLGNPRNDLEWAQWGRFGLLLITTKDTTMDATDELRNSSLDYYAALRSAYRQIRADEIRDGAPAPMDDFGEFDDAGAGNAPSTSQIGSAPISPKRTGTLEGAE